MLEASLEVALEGVCEGVLCEGVWCVMLYLVRAGTNPWGVAIIPSGAG